VLRSLVWVERVCDASRVLVWRELASKVNAARLSVLNDCSSRRSARRLCRSCHTTPKTTTTTPPSAQRFPTPAAASIAGIPARSASAAATSAIRVSRLLPAITSRPPLAAACHHRASPETTSDRSFQSRPANQDRASEATGFTDRPRTCLDLRRNRWSGELRHAFGTNVRLDTRPSDSIGRLLRNACPV
jgi:hypothetical protein